MGRGTLSASRMSRNSVIREEDVKGLIFGTASIHKDYIDIDGYSNKKTIRGMLGDLARAMDNYDKDEADGIRSLINFNEMVQTPPDRSQGAAQFILQWEDVPSATRYNEDKDEMEYKDGRYYVHVRFLR